MELEQIVVETFQGKTSTVNLGSTRIDYYSTVNKSHILHANTEGGRALYLSVLYISLGIRCRGAYVFLLRIPYSQGIGLDLRLAIGFGSVGERR